MPLALSYSIVPRSVPLRLAKVCLALASDNADDMLSTAEAMARDNPFLEFRLDYLKQPASALPKIRRFLDTHQYVTAIGTSRRADRRRPLQGLLGRSTGNSGKAAAAGCQLLDLELESAMKCEPDAVAGLRKRAGLILSFHDFGPLAD